VAAGTYRRLPGVFATAAPRSWAALFLPVETVSEEPAGHTPKQHRCRQPGYAQRQSKGIARRGQAPGQERAAALPVRAFGQLRDGKGQEHGQRPA
jgi:hypothetical protein